MEKKRYTIRRLNNDELDDAFSLIWTVFKQFVAPDYTDEGIACFYDQFIDNQDFRNKFITGFQIMNGAFDDLKLVGVLSISKKAHISCVFVDEKYHRKGIATALFAKVIAELKEQKIDKIHLNASPYAVPFYHAIGFTDTDKEKVYNGIRYTPMEMKLFVHEIDS